MAFNKFSQFKNEGEWNLNQVFSEILKDILIEINRQGLMGDVKGRFNALRILYNNVYGHDKIPLEKLEQIDAMMASVSKRLKRLPEFATNLNPSQKQQMNTVKNLLDQIHRDLLTEMYNAGLIFPISKKDPKFSGMELK